MKLFLNCLLLAVLGRFAISAPAQLVPVYGAINVDLICQIQPTPLFNNPNPDTNSFTLTTKSLLKLIASEQGLTLPPKAKLWLTQEWFYILDHCCPV